MESPLKETIPSVSQDDLAIIKATLNESSQAFGELVEKYQARLYNSIAHLFGPRDAEDIVQDAFVKAFQKLSTFRGTSSFYTWLYRIAFNTAVSYQRRHKTTTSLEQKKEKIGDYLPDKHDRPDECLEKKERAEKIQLALHLLNEEHQTILILREYEEMSYETIAEILKIPVGTIRSRLHRARICLKDAINQVLHKDFE